MLWLLATPSLASQYAPDGIYDVQHRVLDNGLRLITKRRHGAKNVSIRLLVDVGFTDFPCGKRETPHFLEHLLFAGTPQHTEQELDALIEEHGGTWNASTEPERTIYEIDIYSEHMNVALDTLHEMLTTSLLSKKLVNDTRLIVLREGSGAPSNFDAWLHEARFALKPFSLVSDKLLPEIQYDCNQLESAEDVSRKDILAAYQKYYQANNMVLVIVGDFQYSQLNRLMNRTFKKMPISTPREGRVEPAFPVSGGDIAGQLDPLLANDALVYLNYRMVEKDKDATAIWFLEAFLDIYLRDIIRTEYQLSYAQEVERSVGEKFEIFALGAQVNIKDMDEAIFLMKDGMRHLIDKPLSAQTVEKVKRSLLLNIARSYEANYDYADFYIEQWREWVDYGHFINWEDQLEALTPTQIHEAAKRNFQPDKAVVMRVSPTLRYETLYELLGFMTLIIGALVLLYLRKHAMHRTGR